MTSHNDVLFLMCKTWTHFIQITLFKASKSAALLLLIFTINNWKASITTLRSWISESYHHSLISWSLWVWQDHWQSINDYFFSHHLSNFLFNSKDVLKSLNSKSDEFLIRIWWCLHHHEQFSISSIMIIIFDQCFLNKLMILLIAVIVVKSQVVTSLTFIMILIQASIDFIILQLSLSIIACSWFMI